MNAKQYTHQIIDELKNIDRQPKSPWFESQAPTDIEGVILNLLNKIPEKEHPRVHQEFLGDGPLANLVNDDSVTEIIFTPEYIHYEDGQGLKQLEEHFFSEYSWTRFLHRLYKDCRLKIDLQNPTANSSWKGFRVHIIDKPIAQNGPIITLRRKSKDTWNLNRLSKANALSDSQSHILKNLVHDKKSTLVVGTTGSGKTTLVNALLQEVSPTDRTIIIEDTDELFLASPAMSKLLTRETSTNKLSPFDHGQLLKECLRMRPDRIVFGEVRGPEAKDLLLTLSTGHSGFLGTLHAKSAREALWRLEMLVQMGAPSWDQQTIRNLIKYSLDTIVVMGKESRCRKVIEMSHIAGLEKQGFLLEPATERC